MISSRFLNTEVIFDIALEAAKRIDAPRREGGKREALISVVFAAVSLEAFLNELVELARDFAEYENALPMTSAFAQLMSQLSRVPILLRFSMAHWILTGGPYDTDSQHFQALTLLFQVRNDLVHFKPDPLIDQGESKPTHTTLEKLRSKHILNDSSAPETNMSWIQAVGTKAVAEWACNAASLVAADLVSKLPAGDWGETVVKVTQKISTMQFPGEGRASHTAEESRPIHPGSIRGPNKGGVAFSRYVENRDQEAKAGIPGQDVGSREALSQRSGEML